jgi:ABC-type multidrug transport system permease subunit
LLLYGRPRNIFYIIFCGGRMKALNDREKAIRKVKRRNSLIELGLLVRKNIVLLLRSKTSALIVILAPLLLILLIGLSYDNFVGYGLTMGVHSSEFSDDIKSLEESLAAKEYNVVEFGSIEECIDDARQNLVHACLDLPSDFTVDENSAKVVTIHVDQSRVNLVRIVQEVLEEGFDLKSQELSENLLDSLLGTVFSVQDGIDSQAVVLGGVKTNSETVSSTISSASEDLGSGNSGTLDVFENYINGKLSTSQEHVDEIKGKVSNLNNISAADETAILDVLTELENQLTNAQLQMSSYEVYSFNEIRSIVENLEGSISDASLANEDLIVSLSDLNLAITLLSEYSESLSGLEVTDSETLSSPLVTKVETLSDEDSKFNFLFPSILALVGMFLSIMLANTLVMMEKKSPAYIRNVLLPISKTKFILANFLSTLFIVAVQMAILILVSLVFMEEVSFVSFPVMFVAILFGCSVFTLIGMVIGSIFSSEETSTLAAISTGSLFLFLSGVIIPIEGMAPELRGIVELNPYVLLEGVIREEFIFRNPLFSYFEPLSVLLLYAVILFVVILIADLVLHKNLVHKMLYAQHKKARKLKNKEKEERKY